MVAVMGCPVCAEYYGCPIRIGCFVMEVMELLLTQRVVRGAVANVIFPVKTRLVAQPPRHAEMILALTKWDGVVSRLLVCLLPIYT